MPFKKAIATSVLEIEPVRALLAAGFVIRLYGAAQPATPETAIGAQVLIATATVAPAAAALMFPAGAAAVPPGGVGGNGQLISQTLLTFGAAAAGTASFFRCFRNDGTTPIFDDNAYDGATQAAQSSGLYLGAVGAAVVAPGTVITVAAGAFTYTEVT